MVRSDCGLGSVPDIVEQPACEWRLIIGNANVVRAGLIDHEEMAAYSSTLRINRATKLECSIASDEECPPVPPQTKPRGCVPIDARITRNARTRFHQEVADVLESDQIAMLAIRCPGRGDLGVERAGETEKGIDLVAGEIDQDPAVPCRVEVPLWSRLALEEMRPQSGEMQHSADQTRLDQLYSTENRRVVQPLSKPDGKVASRLRLGYRDGIESRPVNSEGLIRENILAACHCDRRNLAPLCWNRRRYDEPDRLIRQHIVQCRSASRGPAAGKPGIERIVTFRHGCEDTPSAHQRLHEEVDVTMVEPHSSEADGMRSGGVHQS